MIFEKRFGLWSDRFFSSDRRTYNTTFVLCACLVKSEGAVTVFETGMGHSTTGEKRFLERRLLKRELMPGQSTQREADVS